MTIQYEISGLARIFHTDSTAACEHQTDTASASNCSSGSVCTHTAVVAIHHLPCHHQDSRRLATNQYEIFGLARIFDADRDDETSTGVHTCKCSYNFYENDLNGGGGGIRTHGGYNTSPVFKTGAINHSTTPPKLIFIRLPSANY